MTKIEVCKFIEKEVDKKFKYQTKYSKELGTTKQAFNKWINKILTGKAGANYSTFEKHLNNLGYEFKIKKIKK